MSRIALLQPVFNSRLNYNENAYARALPLMGHEVVIFTSQDPVNAAHDGEAGVPVRRFRGKRLGSTFFHIERACYRAVRDFAPDYLICGAPGLGWSTLLMSEGGGECRRLIVNSDLFTFFEERKLRLWLKKPLYRYALRHCDLAVGTSPGAVEFLNAFASPADAGKVILVPHIFDAGSIVPEGEAMLPTAVASLKDRGLALIAVVTRIQDNVINRRKRPDLFLRELIRFLETNHGCGLVFAGLDDGELSTSLRTMASGSPAADRMALLPAVQRKEMCGIFRSAVITVWPTLSIGVQLSLACGCPALVSTAEPAHHVIRDGFNGAFWTDLAEIPPALTAALAVRWNRSGIAADAGKNEACSALGRLLEEADQRKPNHPCRDTAS